MAKCQATTTKHSKLPIRSYKGKSNAYSKTQALKAGNKKQQVFNDNNSSSNEEICITHCHKKAKWSTNADKEIDDEFEELDIKEVEDEDNGPISGEESNEVL